MLKKSLYKELKRNPRVSEDSSIAASAWGATVDPYLPEIPDVESVNEQCREMYLSITAERLLFRKKLLGLPVDENLIADTNIATAHPFGEANPTFSELAAPSVRLAAAFVPLTPDENDITLRPVMARLYCVAGLSGRYTLPLAEGLRETDIQNYNWFVAGVKDDVLEMGISGRSWLLAANLLMRIVEKNDMATARNLINNFVVTGNVEDGTISHVTIGRKHELANKAEFRNFRWIVPIKNREEMKNMKAECPETLEAAYELIQTMRNHATNALIETARAGNVIGEAIVHNLKCGADPSQTDAASGQNARQMFADSVGQKIYEIQKALVAKSVEGGIDESYMRDALGKIVDQFLDLVKYDRVMSYYGDAPQMFFMFAQAGKHEMVMKLAEVLDINATDSFGETALDFAEEVGDPLASSVLKRAGATRRGMYELSSDKMMEAMRRLYVADVKTKEEATEHIMAALKNGASPNAQIHLSLSDMESFFQEEWKDPRPQYVDINEADEDDYNPYANHDYKKYLCRRRRYATTIFFESVFSGNKELIEACMSHGGDVDISIPVATVEKLYEETFERSGKQTIKHECRFEDHEFVCNETLSIRELVNDRGLSRNVSLNIREMLGSYIRKMSEKK